MELLGLRVRPARPVHLHFLSTARQHTIMPAMLASERLLRMAMHCFLSWEPGHIMTAGYSCMVSHKQDYKSNVMPLLKEYQIQQVMLLSRLALTMKYLTLPNKRYLSW